MRRIVWNLQKTDVPIGVYEYSKKMTKVRFTEHVPEILSLDTDILTGLYNRRGLENKLANLGENISVPLKFSYGYCLIDGEKDYEKMLAVADARMYKNKQLRKAKLNI